MEPDTTTTLSIKPGALLDARHFDPRMARIFEVVLQEAPQLEGFQATVTSGRDSHTTGLHPEGKAIDFRGKGIQAGSLEERRRRGELWGARVQARLGADYDVRFEIFDDADRDHLHVEYQPKVRAGTFAPGFYARIALTRTVAT